MAFPNLDKLGFWYAPKVQFVDMEGLSGRDKLNVWRGYYEGKYSETDLCYTPVETPAFLNSLSEDDYISAALTNVFVKLPDETDDYYGYFYINVDPEYLYEHTPRCNGEVFGALRVYGEDDWRVDENSIGGFRFRYTYEGITIDVDGVYSQYYYPDEEPDNLPQSVISYSRVFGSRVFIGCSHPLRLDLDPEYPVRLRCDGDGGIRFIEDAVMSKDNITEDMYVAIVLYGGAAVPKPKPPFWGNYVKTVELL